MKKIQEVPIWYNGQIVEAKWISISVNMLVLGEFAGIVYELFSNKHNDELGTDSPDERVQYGRLEMTGQEYADWGDNDEYVWQWTCNKINVVLDNQ